VQVHKSYDSNDVNHLASSFRPNSPFRVISLAASLTQYVNYHFNQVAEVNADLNNNPSNITFLSR
jgi:hypothetical protein